MLIERLLGANVGWHGVGASAGAYDPSRSCAMLKIGAVVLRNTRRVRLLLSISYPYQVLFGQVVKALESG